MNHRFSLCMMGIALVACIGDPFETGSGGGEDAAGPASSVASSSSGDGPMTGSGISSGSSGGDTASSSNVTTSGSSSSSSDGGGGSTGSNGGGSSSSDGGGGSSSSDGGSTGSGDGGGGMGPTDPSYILRWIYDAGPDLHLGIGGEIDQPTGSDTNTDPFEDASSSDPCVAPLETDNEVFCDLGPLESGTRLQLKLYLYLDAAGTNFGFYGCDEDGFPSSDCPGTVEIYRSDLEEPVATFTDDNVAATPPPAPWEYEVVGGKLELVYPSL